METVKFLFTLLIAALMGHCFFSSLFMLMRGKYLKSISYSCIAIFSLIVCLAILFL